MNQFPAVVSKRNSTLHFAASPGYFSHQQYDSLSLATCADQIFTTKSYIISDGSSYPCEGSELLCDSMEWQRIRETEKARAIEDAIGAERNRLARELHDAVTQTLFAASLLAEMLPELWDTDEAEARKSTEDLRQLTRGALAEMRTLLFELRPAAMNQARLCDLLRQLTESVMGRKQLPICLDIQGDCDIPCEVKVEMYRIVQESLNNIVKYARATQVEIEVQLTPNDVHLEIEDDGIGFDSTCIRPTSMGLRIMRERAEAINAELQIISKPGMGTTVIVDWQG